MDGRMESHCFMGMEFQFCEMEGALEMGGGGGCKTVWLYQRPLNWPLKNG